MLRADLEMESVRRSVSEPFPSPPLSELLRQNAQEILKGVSPMGPPREPILLLIKKILRPLPRRKRGRQEVVTEMGP